MSCQQWSLTKFILLTLFTIVESTTSLAHSDHYVDDDQGHEGPLRNLTTEETRVLQREIFKLFGLPDRPKTKTDRPLLVKRSAPNFLLNVYESQINVNKSHSGSRKFDMSQRELLAINRSDVIITFTAQQPRHGAGGKPDRIKRMWFDVTTIPRNEKMTSAELRLYRGSDAKNEKHRGAYAIGVYRVSKTKNGDREKHHVDTVNTAANHRGWIVLNVTEALSYWMANSADNRGIYLSVKPLDGPDHETRPDDIGIVGFKGDVELQPFMAGYFNSDGQGLRLSHSTLNVLHPEKSRKRRSDDIAELLGRKYSTITKFVSRNTIDRCTIRKHYVSLKDLDRQDWIIAPEGYDAWFCEGLCEYPYKGGVNITNHAVLQSQMHRLYPDKIPNPCCAPTKLAPLSILHFLDDNNVILKKYENMIVRGCGCH